jgi:c-di-GMP-binding flagellar brake protein YcgR
MNDKRKYKRTNISIDVEYDLSSEQVWLESRTRDISGGGICLITTERLSLRSEVELRFQLPDQDLLIMAVGKVVWTDEVQTSKKEILHAVGIQFVKIPDEARDYIMKYVEGATFENL